MHDEPSSGCNRLFLNKAHILLVVLAVAVLPIKAHAADTDQKTVVAAVNGTALTEADLQEALNEIMPAAVFHGGFSNEKRMKYRPQALEKMIEKELFYQEAVKQGLPADRGAIEERRDGTIKRLGGRMRFEAALKSAGMTETQYMARLERAQLIEQLITVETVEKARINDADLEDYYRKNKAKYMRPEARQIRLISISVPPNALPEEWAEKKLRAQEVVDKINAGEDMAALAWDYSDDKYKVKGGDLGLVHQGMLEPGLEKEVFNLEKDQVSGVIETLTGYHVVRVEAVKPAEQLTLDDVSEKLRKELSQQKEIQLRTDLIKRLRDTAQIEIF